MRQLNIQRVELQREVESVQAVVSKQKARGTMRDRWQAVQDHGRQIIEQLDSNPKRVNRFLPPYFQDRGLSTSQIPGTKHHWSTSCHFAHVFVELHANK